MKILKIQVNIEDEKVAIAKSTEGDEELNSFEIIGILEDLKYLELETIKNLYRKKRSI